MATLTPSVVTKTVSIASSALPVGDIELVITFPTGEKYHHYPTVPGTGILPTFQITNAKSGNYTVAAYTLAGGLLTSANFTVV